MIDKSTVLQKRTFGPIQLVRKVYPNGWNCPTHEHENALFVFVLNGSFSERYEHKERECQAFSLLYRPPGEKHSELYHSNRVVCISADLNPRWLDGLRERKINLDSSLHANGPRTMPLLTKLNEEMCSPDDVSDLAIEMLMFETAVELHRHTRRTPKLHTSRRLKLAEEFIRDNTSSKLTLKEIATAAGVHPVYLARAFRGKHNCTVAEYIRGRRVEIARIHLTSSRLSLADIAVETGFSDQSHFSRIFKRTTGMTPAQYRTNFHSRG